MHPWMKDPLRLNPTRRYATPSQNSWAILLMRSTYSTAPVMQWNIDINTSYITMQTHAGTTGRTFSNLGRGVREWLRKEKKKAFYGETCVFTFMIFNTSFLLLSLLYHWESSHSSVKVLEEALIPLAMWYHSTIQSVRRVKSMQMLAKIHLF